MKNKSYLLSILVFCFQYGFSQMTIDLGADTVFCPPFPDTAQVNNMLGTNLVISNDGNPPYSYSWHMNPYQLFNTSTYFHASDFLNDTTIQTPWFTQTSDDTLKFYLTVTDSLNQTATDSINVFFLKFIVSTGYSIDAILQGDSVQLNFINVSGGVGPLTYLWRPNYGLSDSTVKSPWAKPDVTTSYHVIVTDSLGCKASGGITSKVIISALGINEAIGVTNPITLYPNPTTGTIWLKDEAKSAESVRVFDNSGKFVTEIEQANFPYDMSDLPKGIYRLQIETKNSYESRTVVLK